MSKRTKRKTDRKSPSESATLFPKGKRRKEMMVTCGS